MMHYAVVHLNATHFVAKISDSNDASISLFTSFFGFSQVAHSDFFAETTLAQQVNDAFKAKLREWNAEATQDDNGYLPLLGA
jgi:hypothetical protein